MAALNWFVLQLILQVSTYGNVRKDNKIFNGFSSSILQDYYSDTEITCNMFNINAKRQHAFLLCMIPTYKQAKQTNNLQ